MRWLVCTFFVAGNNLRLSPDMVHILVLRRSGQSEIFIFTQSKYREVNYLASKSESKEMPEYLDYENVSQYDQAIPQSQTADPPTAP